MPQASSLHPGPLATLRQARRSVALVLALSGAPLLLGATPGQLELGHGHGHGHGNGNSHGLEHQEPHPGMTVDREARSVTVEATAQPETFEAGLPPDHQYHALVHEDGGAAARSLFVTAVPDTAVARVLRELGAEDGGGVPMSAWNLRWVPLVPQPASRVQGSPLQVTVHWEGSPGNVRLGELLSDPGGQGTDFRFGGNEEHDHHWDSGCILCLYSCPGGVVSNAAYTIRDHQRGTTHFAPNASMPPEGTRVLITFTLDPP